MHDASKQTKSRRNTMIDYLGVRDENYLQAGNLLGRRYNNRRAFVEKNIQTLMDLPQISQWEARTLGKSLDIMCFVVHNLRKVRFHTDHGVIFTPFIITRYMGGSTRSEFDSYLQNPKQRGSINEIDRFLENRYVIMAPGWDEWNGATNMEDSNHSKEVTILANPIVEKKK